MTREAYLDMCFEMGTDPIEEEIHAEIEEFPPLFRTAINIYHTLPDVWEGFSGSYLGKNYTILFDLMDIYEIECQEERKLCLTFLQMLDNIRISIINEKLQNKNSPREAK